MNFRFNKLILLCIEIIFCLNYLQAQDENEFLIGASFGQNLLTIKDENTNEKQNSNTYVTFGLKGQYFIPLKQQLSIGVSLSIIKNGHKYKVENYLEEGRTLSIYSRLELNPSIGICLFEAIGKERKKRKRKRIRNSILLYVGIQTSFSLSSSYFYAIDQSYPTDDLYKSFVPRLETRVGFKSYKYLIYLQYKNDLSKFIEYSKTVIGHYNSVTITFSHKLKF